MSKVRRQNGKLCLLQVCVGRRRKHPWDIQLWRLTSRGTGRVDAGTAATLTISKNQNGKLCYQQPLLSISSEARSGVEKAPQQRHHGAQRAHDIETRNRI